MQDTPPQKTGISLTETVASAYGVTVEQAAAIVRAVDREFTWHLRKNTLSRGGLADLVEALGSGHHAEYLVNGNLFRDESARRDGNAILGHVLGSKDGSRMLASRVAQQVRASPGTVGAMLPYLAAAAMGGLAVRARTELGAIVAQVPSLGRHSRATRHADLAGILRRQCGAGPYSPRVLPRVVRQAVAHAAGFPNDGVLLWYARFIGGRAGARWARLLAARPRQRSA